MEAINNVNRCTEKGLLNREQRQLCTYSGFSMAVVSPVNLPLTLLKDSWCLESCEFSLIFVSLLLL